MSIAKRLTLLVVCGVGALLLLSGINFLQMNRVFEKANFGNENVVPSVLVLDRALLELGHLRVRTYRHVLLHDAAQMAELDNKIQDARNAMTQALKDYEPLIINDEDRRLLEAERAALANYTKALDEIFADSRANRKDEARELLIKYAAVAEQVNDGLVAHMKFNEEIGKKAAQDAVAAKQSAIWIAAVVFLLTLAVLSLFGWGTTRSLSSRVAEANRMAERIARGDLSRDVSAVGAGNDEIGQLLASLDKMRDDLGKTISDIVSEAEVVASSSSHLSTAAQQVAASSDSQSQSTSSAAAAVEQLTVSIDHVGGSADDASQRAKDAEAKAVASGQDVEHASGQIAEVANRVEHSAQQIQTLSEQVQQINNITVVIREVADQTNLLALNAAIEAARAGEQGRGFAVVADEVRKLAERTTHSVQEIASMITTIQDGAVSAVSSMQSSRQVVNDVVATAGRASASMREIRSSAETVQKSIAGISDALREQRSASVELSRNVETIAQMSEENSSAVASVAKTANNLVGVADKLKQSVARFRL